jgi:undecaprenyl diphosphate synthase
LTAESGEVDLLIRTGGEKRLSDFLLWECAYAELVFLKRMWPDFVAADLDSALDEFHHRERRFGGVPALQECGQLPARV